jgi:hypothetical protein
MYTSRLALYILDKRSVTVEKHAKHIQYRYHSLAGQQSLWNFEVGQRILHMYCPRHTAAVYAVTRARNLNVEPGLQFMQDTWRRRWIRYSIKPNAVPLTDIDKWSNAASHIHHKLVNYYVSFGPSHVSSMCTFRASFDM